MQNKVRMLNEQEITQVSGGNALLEEIVVVGQRDNNDSSFDYISFWFAFGPGVGLTFSANGVDGFVGVGLGAGVTVGTADKPSDLKDEVTNSQLVGGPGIDLFDTKVENLFQDNTVASFGVAGGLAYMEHIGTR